MYHKFAAAKNPFRTGRRWLGSSFLEELVGSSQLPPAGASEQIVTKKMGGKKRK